MTDTNDWASLIEASQDLKAEDLVPAFARMQAAQARAAANDRQRADDPSIRDIRVYPRAISPSAVLRSTLVEAMLIEIRYMLQRGDLFVTEILAAIPGDQLESLARNAYDAHLSREIGLETAKRPLERLFKYGR